MNILLVAGSNRKGATSTRLCHYVRKLIAAKGHEARIFDLFERPVPFYSPDHDAGHDANLRDLKKAAAEADAIVLSTPEYHGGISGVLKNALDHLGFEHFDGKVVLSMSSSGGAVGVSSLQQLQTVVRNVHGVNCTEWISIGGDNRTFTPDGEPENEKIRERVDKTVNYFLRMAELHADRRIKPLA